MTRFALRHIMPDDLTNTARLLILFDEAQAQGLIGGSESERLTFVATAERARLRAITNAPGLFAELVRRRLWHFVTQDNEDQAQTRLRKHFYGGREEGRALIMKRPSEVLSKDALFIADVSARLQRHGFSGDMFAAVNRELPDWTRERWERAMTELEHAKKQRCEATMGQVSEVACLLIH